MGTRETVNHMPGMDKSGNIHWNTGGHLPHSYL